MRYVLEGSVRKAGNRVRITGQLIDTATLGHIWADRFDGALDNIFELQDQVTVGVVCAIEPKLRLAEIDRALRKPTENLDAYDLYLRALAQASKRTKEGVAEAVSLARRALELDPGYGPAMARLAQTLAMQGVRGWIPLSGPEAQEGIRMARQAIADAGDDQSTLIFAGLAIAILIRDYDAALAAIDRAIDLNPNFALAIAYRAQVLSYQHDRADEAIRWAERALSLSPLDPGMVCRPDGDGLRASRGGPLRDGAALGRAGVARKGWTAVAEPQAELLRPSRPAARGRRVPMGVAGDAPRCDDLPSP